jgi:hypothetical protein
MLMRATVTILLFASLAAPAAAQTRVDTTRVRTVIREAVRHAPAYQRGAQEETETTTRTVKLGAKGELNLFNLSGDIVVTRGSGNEATIQIVKRARAATAEAAREALKRVTVEVDERGERVEVRTRYPEMARSDRRQVHASVDYTVSAPANTRMTIRSLSGDIRVTDIAGDLFLDTTSGDVDISGAARVGLAKSISGDVTISATRTEGAVEASSISGNVILRDVQAARAALSSISGGVDVQGLRSERVDANSMTGDIVFNGALTPNGRYELKSHSGSINLQVAGSTGFDLDATTFSGTIRTDLPLKTQGGDQRSGRGRRSFRGVFGDGSAMITVTTFSGSVAIGKQ